MPLQIDCKVFIENPSEIRIDGDNLVHIIDREGDQAIERIMSPHTLLAYIERARRVFTGWERGRS